MTAESDQVAKQDAVSSPAAAAAPKEKKPYPWYVVCFLSNEFCERFAYYGMRAILVLYLSSLGFDEDSCTAIYHAFIVGAYAWPLLGAALADGYFGRYKVILWFSLIYVVGMGLQAFSALPFLAPEDSTFKTANAVICLTALIIIGLGTGGIKPCVSTLGGDQFDDDDEDGREFFFNMFYLSINIGSLISEFITPKIRGIKCGSLGYGDSCYFVAFLIPACLMAVALVVFIAGTKWYIVKPPSGDNIFFLHLKAIHHGLWNKGKGDEEHWLDKAKGDVPDWVIRDMKYFIPMLYVLIPQPIFWCAYDQSGSRWVLQALKMDGWIGDSVLILPDQIVILNGAMIIIFVPLFSWCYKKIDNMFRSCLGKPDDWRLCTELKRWTLGYICLGVAFIVAAILQTNIEKDMTIFPTYNSEVSIRAMSAASQPIVGHFEVADPEQKGWDAELEQDFMLSNKGDVTMINDTKTNEILVNTDGEYSFVMDNGNRQSNFKIEEGRLNWNMVVFDEGEVTYPSWTEKNENGKNFVEVVNGKSEDIKVEFRCAGEEEMDGASNKNCEQLTNITISACQFNEKRELVSDLCVKGYQDPSGSDDLLLLIKGTYQVWVDGEDTGASLTVVSGATYTVAVFDGETRIITDINSNSVPMAWIIPQYAILTAAEVFFVTTGYIFCYEQTPFSLKSVVQAYLLLGSAVGNIFVIIVAESKLFPTQTIEFLFFAGLLFVGAIINVILSRSYVYVDNSIFATFEYPNDDNKSIEEGAKNLAVEEDEKTDQL